MAVFTRTRRRRRDKPRATRTIILGLVVVAFFGLLAFNLLRLYNGLPTTNYAKYYVSTPLVGNLLQHDAVRIAGKRVGQVRDIKVGSDGQPRVQLQLDPGTKLPNGTGVRLRANGLLGARYVELVPGRGPGVLDQGATIRGTVRSYTYGVPEAVAVFDKSTRGGLSQTIKGLGEGVDGNGAMLNEAIGNVGTATGQFTQVARSILARHGAAARLFPSFASAFRQLDRTNYAVHSFTKSAGDAVTPFVTQRAAVRSTLTEAPAALAVAAQGLRQGTDLMASLRRFSTAADRTLRGAPSGFTQVAALLSEARGPLRRAAPQLAKVGPGAQGATEAVHALASQVAARAVSGLTDARPILKTVGDHACDVEDAAVSIRSMDGMGQAGTGPLGPAMAFRLQAVVPDGPDALGIKDFLNLIPRDALEAPCKYPQRPYGQFVPKGLVKSSTGLLARAKGLLKGAKR